VVNKKFELLPSTHLPDAYLAVDPVHEVTEGDAIEGYLVMFLRTGQRGFFDWAEAVGSYFRGHAVYRSDWGQAWGTGHGRLKTLTFTDVEKKLVRGRRRRSRPLGERERGTTAQPTGWYRPHCFDWWDARMHECHHYAGGLLDLYCITGNVDAKDALIDLAEDMADSYTMHIRIKPGGSFTFGRSQARVWITMMSAWRATRDEQWKPLADRAADWVLKAENWDPELSYYREGPGPPQKFVDHWTKGYLETDRTFPYLRDVPPRLAKYLDEHGIKATYKKHQLRGVKGEKQWEIHSLGQTFQTSIMHMAMERYARLFDSKPMQERVVAVARGARKLLWSEKTGHAIYRGYLNWPEPGRVAAPSLWADEPAISGWQTRFLADMWARAYTFSRDEELLAWAKEAWDRGSKRKYKAKEQAAGPDEVGSFAKIHGTHHDDCLETCVRLFHHVSDPKAKE
jgi:hypothetical protein